MQLLDNVPPCPFCGGQPKTHINTYHEWSIHCSQCGVAFVGKGSQRTAIDQWCARYQPDLDLGEAAVVDTTMGMAIFTICSAKLYHERSSTTLNGLKFTEDYLKHAVELSGEVHAAFMGSHYNTVEHLVNDLERLKIIKLDDDGTLVLMDSIAQFAMALRIQRSISERASMNTLGAVMSSNVNAQIQLGKGSK